MQGGRGRVRRDPRPRGTRGEPRPHGLGGGSAAPAGKRGAAARLGDPQEPGAIRICGFPPKKRCHRGLSPSWLTTQDSGRHHSLSQKHRTACSQTPGPGLVLPRPHPHHSLDPLGPLLCPPDSHPFPASHAQQQGWEPRTAGRRGRSKGIAAAFLRTQRLFQTEQNKKGMLRAPLPLLLGFWGKCSGGWGEVGGGGWCCHRLRRLCCERFPYKELGWKPFQSEGGGRKWLSGTFRWAAPASH